jgi:hypothetical protein
MKKAAGPKLSMDPEAFTTEKDSKQGNWHTSWGNFLDGT